MRKEPLYVSIVVDVEEEGLFSGCYPREVTVDNVAHLPKLAPITDECAIPLTLVCSHPVFVNTESCRILEQMRHKYNAEIGVHLHYWCTPPYSEHELSSAAMCPYVQAKDMPQDIMREKFKTIFAAAKDFCGYDVTTFRMGRWDMSKNFWPVLAENGVQVDSSIRPWQYPKQWRDHFLAPIQPYKVQIDGKTIIEIPDTSVPLVPTHPVIQRALYHAPALLKHSWHRSIVMLPSPVHHSLAYMKAAAMVMLARGDKVLNLTWHSTEIAPGATPHLPNQASVDRVIERARLFLLWLHKQVPVRGITLGQFATEKDFHIPDLHKDAAELPGDWHP